MNLTSVDRLLARLIGLATRYSRVGIQTKILVQTNRTRRSILLILFAAAHVGIPRRLVDDALVEIWIIRDGKGAALGRGGIGGVVVQSGLSGRRGVQLESLIENVGQIDGARRDVVLAGTALGRVEGAGEAISGRVVASGRGGTVDGIVSRSRVQ